MKEIWVLSVKTSLPDICFNSADMETTITGYKTFTEARDAFRRILREFAFSKNSMFDGDGNMIYLKKYLDEAWEPDADDFVDVDMLTKDNLTEIYNALKTVFEGNEYDISKFNDYYTDYMIAIEVKDGTMLFHGEDDGPCNGYDPDIATNIFSMQDEKDYFLYIDDCLGQDDATSELYIDLKKVAVD